MSSIPDALEITAAQPSEQVIVARLMQLYQHDFSEFARTDLTWGDVGADGLFSFIYLESYWAEERRKPFLFRVNGKLIGFAFINDWSASGRPVDWCMSEFFVMRKYRRSKLGSRAASQVVRKHRGVWEIPISSYNHPALAFWVAVSAGVVSHGIEELKGDGVRWSGPILRLTPRES